VDVARRAGPGGATPTALAQRLAGAPAEADWL